GAVAGVGGGGLDFSLGPGLDAGRTEILYRHVAAVVILDEPADEVFVLAAMVLLEGVEVFSECLAERNLACSRGYGFNHDTRVPPGRECAQPSGYDPRMGRSPRAVSR